MVEISDRQVILSEDKTILSVIVVSKKLCEATLTDFK